MAGSLDEPGHEGGGGMRARRSAGTRRDARRRYRRACRRIEKKGGGHGAPVQRFLGSTCIGPNLDVYAAPPLTPPYNQPAPTALQTNFACEAKISLANWKISLAKRLISLAKRLSSLQAIEIVGVENFRFRLFVRFQRFTISPYPFSVPARRRLALDSVSQNSPITRIRFQGKLKGESLSLRFPANDRLVRLAGRLIDRRA